ncbi:MAG: GntR family transcriptional regulator [Lachnospiraceae bacterium]|nr:GntR family transcriptional regulator [Lachnospiraceae bacterium]MBR5667425.1 GntR family transcriptional regulator [Lachnospiraceae bacterium]
MYVTIDFNSDEAFYIQLKKQIIMGIAMAEIREGDSLPSVRDMADDIGINMHTVNKAYAILKQEGYLKLDRRRGAVVCLDPDRLRAVSETRARMRETIAGALCRDLSPKELHTILDEVLAEFGYAGNENG